MLVQGKTKSFCLQEGYTKVTNMITFIISTYNKYIHNEMHYFTDECYKLVSLSCIISSY